MSSTKALREGWDLAKKDPTVKRALKLNMSLEVARRDGMILHVGDTLAGMAAEIKDTDFCGGGCPIFPSVLLGKKLTLTGKKARTDVLDNVHLFPGLSAKSVAETLIKDAGSRLQRYDNGLGRDY